MRVTEQAQKEGTKQRIQQRALTSSQSSVRTSKQSCLNRLPPSISRSAAMSEDVPSSTAPTEAAPSQSTEVEMSSSDSALPADIRQQVEQEQALADTQKRLKALEEDNEKLRKEKKDVEDARDGAG
jgi:hypothetical protein